MAWRSGALSVQTSSRSIDVKAAKWIIGILSIVVVAPIWYYLLYKILVAIQATELMWFLYWLYLPAALLSATIAKIVEMQK